MKEKRKNRKHFHFSAMKILSAEQIRAADRYAIEHEPIASIDLMERAAWACTKWLLTSKIHGEYKIFCGTGNNGGDGLAIARMLLKKKISASIYIVPFGNQPTKDFLTNRKRLEKLSRKSISEITSAKQLPRINKNDIAIDALFGTGINRKPEGIEAKTIQHINKSSATVIAIDMPSGLFADVHTPHKAVIHATHTLSFQVPKLAFLFPENERYVGSFHVLDIGLDKKFIASLASKNFFTEQKKVEALLPERKKFSHKGTYGHALIAAGSYGMMGASVMCTRSVLHSGVGLVTAFVPKCGYEIMQRTVPEAMAVVSAAEKFISGSLPKGNFTSVVIGPGIGKDKGTFQWLSHYLPKIKVPLLLDADALNIIAENKSLLKKIPAGSVLTPHPGEFQRLAVKSKNDFQRFELLKSFAKKYNMFVVLKGANTCITTPTGEAYFNSTGNPGMAKGGSGDVLSGIIGALLARGLSPLDASIAGVYLHGLAGDIAAKKFSMESMTASDIIDSLGAAFKSVAKK
jgi:ADP-dependent NAD(P)H-hydrate dehydratase / NAD(P)H-hydrate epimerase